MKADHSLDFQNGPFPSLQLKITPPLPSLLQVDVVMVGSRNVSCSASKSKKSNPTLNIPEKNERNAKYCEKYFFQKIYIEDCSYCKKTKKMSTCNHSPSCMHQRILNKKYYLGK